MSDYAENLFPKISRDKAHAMISQADKAYESKKYRKAIRLFSQALQASLPDVDRGYVFYMKGKSYHEIGDDMNACKQWSKAIELDLAQHPLGIDIINEEYRKHCG